MIALYHRIYKQENFEKAATDLLELIFMAQEREPDTHRALYVDIEEHRNETGGFDEDMRELQTEFGVGFLLQFVKEIHFPLACVKNSGKQNNDVPRKLLIENSKNEQDDSLTELYIENYSNTEFLTEDDVYEYMKKVSDFLKVYNESMVYAQEKEGYDSQNKK